MLAVCLNTIHFIVLAIFIFLDTYSYIELIIMSLGLLKPLILMLYCEHYSVLMSQSYPHQYYYLMYLLSDCFLTLPVLVGVYLVFNSYVPLDNTYHLMTILLHSYVPFLTKTIFRSLSKQTNLNMSNKPILHFYLIWIGLI